jgi:hypothetical protein
VRTTTLSGNPPIEPVPRGTFESPIQLPQQQSSACLAKMNESVAWQCASNIIFQVNVGPLLDNSTTTTVTFDPSPESFNNASIRGQQPPNFRSVELKQITETELGPTYYFRLRSRCLTRRRRARSSSGIATPTVCWSRTIRARRQAMAMHLQRHLIRGVSVSQSEYDRLQRVK